MRRARPQRTVGIFAAAALAGTTAGCGNQSTLSPDSHASRVISNLWWGMLVGSAVLFAVVVALLLYGLLRRHGSDPDEREPIGGGTWIVAIGGFAVPLVVLVVLFVVTIAALPATSPGGKTQMTIDVVGAPVVLGRSLPGRGSADRERDPHPGRRVRCSSRVDERRRDPQLLGAGAEPQDRRDPRPDERGRLAGRPCRASSAASAPSSAAPARPHGAVRRRRAARRSSRRGCAAQSAARRPSHSTATSSAGSRSFSARPASTATRSPGRTRAGTIGPDLTHVASRLSLGAGTLPNNEGQPRRLDPRSPARQARQPDAGDRADRARSCSRCSPTWRACADRRGASSSGSSAPGRSPAGFVAALTTVDHKRIGIRYLVTASVFFLLGGVEALVMRAQLAGPNERLLSPEALRPAVHDARR